MREPKNQLNSTGSYPADMSTGGTAEATQAACGIVPCIRDWSLAASLCSIVREGRSENL
jgi:hypothetical protein